MGLFLIKTPPMNFVKLPLTPLVCTSSKQTSAVLYFTIFVCRRIVCRLKSPVALKQREVHCDRQIIGGSLELQTLGRFQRLVLSAPLTRTPWGPV
ncbi:hypothetical protein OJAV_G00052640 [Oryzias javanicus]|uniref:Uncharacterized protein n=1 Tax=Oryzias javanicus TaxID=123683 RepID=A0A437D9S8_ORYJA|nr:hypothetical protein OJAV_G00052640 [Oryzias javanicus]